MESRLSRHRTTRGSLDALVATLAEGLSEAVGVLVPKGTKFEQQEQTILRLGEEVMRRCLERRLQELADSSAERVRVDKRRYRRHQPGTVKYHSLCGPLRVERWSYREEGVRNGPTVVPLELEAKLIMRATPALCYSAAQGFASMPVRHYLKQMEAAHRRPPSRTTLERLSRFLGGCASQDAMRIERVIRPQEELPKDAHVLVIGLDRTSAPMAEERPPSQPPNSCRRPRTKEYVRKRPPPIDVNYRMVYVGTVAIFNNDCEALTVRRYAATPEEGPSELVSRMMADVMHLRRQRALPLLVLQDGAPELWNLLREALTAQGLKQPHPHRPGDWLQLVDRYHANEHIAAALSIAVRHRSRRTELFQSWRKQIDANDSSLPRLVKWLETFERDHSALSRRARVLLGKHTSYLSSYQQIGSMRYAKMHKLKFPTGSGTTEATCKSLVALRIKRSGQRWQHDGLTSVLTLRSLLLSDRLHRFWPHFTRRFAARVSVDN
jgi:hypothetical protein